LIEYLFNAKIHDFQSKTISFKKNVVLCPSGLIISKKGEGPLSEQETDLPEVFDH